MNIKNLFNSKKNAKSTDESSAPVNWLGFTGKPGTIGSHTIGYPVTKETLENIKGYDITAGNSQIFPKRHIAEIYKRNYESHPWFHEELIIREADYEGVPLSESIIINGRELIDREHYFGLDACEVGCYITEDLLDELLGMLPPACTRSDCSQIGEPVSHRIAENGFEKPTYATFKKVEAGIWEYCGDCFRWERMFWHRITVFVILRFLLSYAIMYMDRY